MGVQEGLGRADVLDGQVAMGVVVVGTSWPGVDLAPVGNRLVEGHRVALVPCRRGLKRIHVVAAIPV